VGSVLASGRDDFEVIVIDDCSTDDTAAVVEALGDPRVRLVRQPVNRGVCEARNAGIAAARGRWMVMLDSDFELLPGGLDLLAARCDAAPADVGNVATVCRWDRGPDTPDPTPTESALLDLPAYLRFIGSRRVSEWFNCYRREVFAVLRYPSGRAYESSFHLAAATRWRFWMCIDRVVLIHTDATNRITASAPLALARRQLRDAADGAADADAVLRGWGAVLRAHEPRMLAHYEAQRVTQHLLAGPPAGGPRRARPRQPRAPALGPPSGPSSRSGSSGRGPSRTPRRRSARSSAASAGDRAMSPTVDQLRTFLTIAETLSFRAAARSLVVAPAVVSERVRQLEAALGAPLFRRTTRSVALTPQGQALIPYARRAVDAMLDCAHAAGERLPAPRAELVLGVEPEAAARWVAPLLSRWARLRPELTVHLHVGDHDALHAALVRHQIDAAVLGPARCATRACSPSPLVGLAWRMVAAPRRPAPPGPAGGRGRQRLHPARPGPLAALPAPVARRRAAAAAGGALRPGAAPREPRGHRARGAGGRRRGGAADADDRAAPGGRRAAAGVRRGAALDRAALRGAPRRPAAADARRRGDAAARRPVDGLSQPRRPRQTSIRSSVISSMA
jgi:DNA-binding transcriptional LysR family regulator